MLFPSHVAKKLFVGLYYIVHFHLKLAVLTLPFSCSITATAALENSVHGVHASGYLEEDEQRYQQQDILNIKTQNFL